MTRELFADHEVFKEKQQGLYFVAKGSQVTPNVLFYAVVISEKRWA